MSMRMAAALLLAGGLGAAPAFSQTSSTTTTTTQTVTTAEPVFRVSVVGRTIQAVNYRPRNGATEVDMVGTPLLPNGKGTIKLEGEQGYIEIDARFSRLEAPAKYGPEYLTYVLWAITPEGRATNLGEVQYKGSDQHIEVTTELQAFALVLTAEPYFAVSQPSDAVVMENVIRPEKFASLRDGTQGRFEVVDAKYELLKRGAYLQAAKTPSDYKVKALEPGAPLDLAEARNAVEIARLAGADRFAADSFQKAVALLNEAEKARADRKSGNTVQQPAREAAQTAEDARLIAIQRQEDAFQAEQRRLALEAQERARLEAERARQADANRLAADAARAAAERDRLEAERLKAEADAARAAAERDRQSADAARLAAEQQAQAARDAAAQATAEQDRLRQQLRDQLNVILETRETARGLIVNLSDVLFDFNKADLKPGAREKLSRIAGIIQSHPGLKMSIEGHTDSIGSDAYNQQLSERRAASVQAYLSGQGVAREIVGTAGFGESKPVASNDNAAGRQQNRRVELVVSGEPIGR